MKSNLAAIDTNVALDALGVVEIPPALRASVERHKANLARLVQTLQLAGMQDEQIEESVATMVSSYRAELVSAIKSIVRNQHV